MTTICFDRTSFFIGIMVIALIGYLFFQQETKHCNVEIMDRIVDSTRQLGDLVNRKVQDSIGKEVSMQDRVAIRDQAVISNPLYPPLGRTERPVFDRINDEFNASTRGGDDTYRLLGYLVNKNATDDLGRNVWKLFGRQQYRGSSRGEFYALPADGDKKDMKVSLKDDMFMGEKLRDIYALPNKVSIKSPFFSTDEYDLVELPKADFTSQYI